MDARQAYREEIVRIAGRIREFAPPDLVERFALRSGFDAASYRTCGTDYDGAVCAVDGSNAVALDAGSFSIAAVRAAESTYAGGGRVHRRVTPLRLVTIGPGEANEDYGRFHEACFGCPPDVALKNDDAARAAAVFRDALEYRVALEMAFALDPGDLLVLDGALRVSHASHATALEDLLRVCDRRGVLLAAVTKRTSLTWGGGHPIVPAAEGLAHQLGVPEPWYVRLPKGEIVDREAAHTWQQRGDQYIARLHPRAQRAFKIELPEYDERERIDRAFAALAAYADDGRVTGYPYPLLDAHLAARINRDVVEQIRQDLARRMSELGMGLADYTGIFGDYHDELERY